MFQDVYKFLTHIFTVGHIKDLFGVFLWSQLDYLAYFAYEDGSFCIHIHKGTHGRNMKTMDSRLATKELPL